jgi:hypothetical protein
MLRASRILLVVAAVCGGGGALVIVAEAPAFLGSILAVAAAVSWCLFLDRSTKRPW